MANLIAVIILLIFSAFFSGSETALFSLTSFQKKNIASRNPAVSKIINILLASPRRTLATILTGNMIVNITATGIVTLYVISNFGENMVGVSILFMTFILLIFGEVTPKTIAIQHPEGFSAFCSMPLHLLAKIIWPVRYVIRLIADIFLTPLNLRKQQKQHITQKEIKALLTISEKEGVIEKEEEEMIHSIFELGDKRVNEIMTPRIEIVGCDRDVATLQLIDIMRDSKHNKIPIYEDTVDRITGIIYTKEYMLHANGDIERFLKKPLYVPGTEKVFDLLIQMQSQKTDMAVVLDEFGGTAGIVAIEDILEEIVGEIRDEYDKEITHIKKEDDGSFTVSGRAAIRDVNYALGISLPLEEVTTINGFMLLLFDRVPKPHEQIRFKNVLFEVLEVKNNMVTRAAVRK